MSEEINRDDVRPSQVQYQLMTAMLAIGNAYDSADDAPGGVNEALEHIQTAMNLLGNPNKPLSECRPTRVQFQAADSVHTTMEPHDWCEVAESEFVDIARSELGDDIAFVFEHEAIGLHGFRWRSPSKTLEAASFDRVSED